MDNTTSKVYIRVDNQNNIVAIDGGYSISNIKDIENWIQIDEGNGDKYNLCQNNYLDKPIIDYEHGLYRYTFINGQIVEKDLSAEIVKAAAQKIKDAEIAELKAYLDSTDYAITKIAERQALGMDISGLLAEYADVIRRRSEARTRIEELMT